MQKRNLTKDKIIQTALSLADEIGLNQVTFPKLAEKLEIKYPSLYNHFANMDDLKNGMILYLYTELNTRLMMGLIGKSGEEAIREYACVFRDFAFEHRAAYGLFMSIPGRNNEQVTALSHETNEIINRILSFYNLDHESQVHKSRALRSLVHGFISMVFLGYFRADVDVEDSFQTMLNDFISTLHK